MHWSGGSSWAKIVVIAAATITAATVAAAAVASVVTATVAAAAVAALQLLQLSQPQMQWQPQITCSPQNQQFDKKRWVKWLSDKKTRQFLTILFALLLDCNVFLQAAAAAWQKMVYGLRYHVWCIGTKSRISLKKRWAEKLKNHQHSLLSHLTFTSLLLFQ